MPETPLVSLCIPIYNADPFLNNLIDNIRQIIYQPLEIIIADDNSNDESLSLLKAANLPNCQIYTHERYGLVNNWNFCLKKAQGKYIKFLFQDDKITPDCVNKMVELAQKDAEIGLVFSRRKLIWQTGTILPNFPENLHLSWSNLAPIQSGINLLEDSNLCQHPHNKIGEPTNVLIVRQVFDDVGYFDDTFQQYVDLEMWLRIMTKYKIAFLDEILAYFTIHEQQTTLKNIEHTDLEIYQVWLKMLTHPSYQNIPLSTRKTRKKAIITILFKQFLKTLLFGQIHKAYKLLAISQQFMSI